MAADPTLQFCQANLHQLTGFAEAFLLISIIAAAGWLLIGAAHALWRLYLVREP